MCTKEANESNASFGFRMVEQKPRTVLAISGWLVAALFAAFAYIMYADFKESGERQTAAYLEVAQLIKDMDLRLQVMDAHLRQLDGWHRQEFKQE